MPEAIPTVDLRFIPRWYIMFEGPRERRFLIDVFTGPGFRHCLAFAFDPGGERWLIYDVTRRGTAILALTGAQFPDWLTTMKVRERARVLQYDLPDHAPHRFWLQTGMWCVTAIIHLVGLRSSAWRPAALWRDLIRAGAIEVFK